MKVTATHLRTHLYKLLDEVLQSGSPLEIERKGQLLVILPAQPTTNRLERIAFRDCIVGDPEDLVHNDWSGEWRPSI